MAMIYWLWLATRPGCSVRFCHGVLEQFGTPEAVWQAGREELSHLPHINASRLGALMEKDLTYPRRIERDCRRLGIQMLHLQDPSYPEPLRQIADPPLVLYVRGTLPDFTGQLSISIVGTRSCTEYGLHAARYFAGNLAQQGCIIVSGMALGIDGAANRAALEAGGITVAVLGSGVDVCYPWEHKKLMEQILRHGAVISEYPPGTEPKGWHFPVRNRIITGLSRGTLVVEAPKRSGALISADLALEQGRDVFAVPGDINRASCAGCNRLIRQGAAELAQEPSDILAHYGSGEAKQEPRRYPPREQKQVRQIPITEPADQPKQAQSTAPAVRPKPKPAVSPVERTVWQAVQQGHTTVDAVVEATRLPAASVLAALTMLEIGTYVRLTGSGYQTAEDI